MKHEIDFNLVAMYLLNDTDRYFNLAREDAEKLFRDNKKEFKRILGLAQTDSDENDEAIVRRNRLKMLYDL